MDQDLELKALKAEAETRRRINDEVDQALERFRKAARDLAAKEAQRG